MVLKLLDYGVRKLMQYKCKARKVIYCDVSYKNIGQETLENRKVY